MASKYQLITGLYESTIKDVTKNAAEWTAFLRSACRNYKCRFDEQILIYAQRPDATAVLEIEKWNEQFGRWVNKGAKGIAVFDDDHNGQYRLKHYFDISDTHGSRFDRPVPIWQMRPEHEAEVIESLENSFGGLEDKDTLAEALVWAARNATEDNIEDYLRDLLSVREDSFLEELDEFNVEVEYREVVQNSVTYMLLTRCGIDADRYFSRADFQYLYQFNTPGTVNALGLAASDIAESCLREIAVTVRSLQRQGINMNRTLASPEKQAQNSIEIQTDERGAEDDRSIDLSDRGRLSNPEPDLAGGAGHTLGKYALLRKKYLQQSRRVLYMNFLTAGTLNGHLTEIEQAAGERMERMTRQMAAAQGVTEQLKASDQMKWVGMMNNIRQSAEELILQDLIYA